MKRRRAITAGVLFVLVALVGGPGLGKGNPTTGGIVREAVVSKLGPDGAVRSTIVSQLLRLDAEEGTEVELRVPKAPDLDSYRNLSGFSGPAGEGNDMVWRTSDHLDATTLSRIERDLPVTVHIRYFLDGNEMSADEISGREGDVRIEVELVNVSGEPETLKYKAVTSPALTSVANAYTPFQYVVRVEFPTDEWTGVGGAGVSVASQPGVELATAAGFLTPPLTRTSQTVTFQGHTDNARRPRIQVFATPQISEQILGSLQSEYEGLKALYGGVGDIRKNLNAAYEGTIKLVDGLGQVLGGLGARDPKTGKPIVDPDTKTILGGIGQIIDGLNAKLLPSLGRRDAKTGKGIVHKDAKGKLDPATLIAGLQDQKDAFDDALIPSMDDLLGGLDLLIDGVDSIIGKVSSQDATDPGLVEGLQQLSGGLTQLKAGLQTGSGALTGLSVGLGTLMSNVDEHPNVDDPSLPPGSPTDFIEALTAIKGLALAALATNPVVFGQILAIVDGVDLPPSGEGPEDIPGLLDKIGSRDPGTGAPNLRFDAPGSCGAPVCPSDAITTLTVLSAILDGNAALGIPQGVIAGLGSAIAGINTMKAGLDGLIIPGLGARDANGDPVIILDAEGNPTTLIGALGFVGQILGLIEDTALTNPQWTKPQLLLDGKTPKAYYDECPACFDPDASVFDPDTVGLGPGFRDVFVLFSEGIRDALPKLHSFDSSKPGLVDGLEQVADGLEQVAGGLDNIDPKGKGIANGLKQVRGGLQQVSQGLFALDELGLRTVGGQVGDQGDAIARDKAGLEQRAKAAGRESELGVHASAVSTAYVFELPAQSTTARDNAVRGGLMAFALAAMGVLARRPRVFGL